jgi:hypothetical protein
MGVGAVIDASIIYFFVIVVRAGTISSLSAGGAVDLTCALVLACGRRNHTGQDHTGRIASTQPTPETTRWSGRMQVLMGEQLLLFAHEVLPAETAWMNSCCGFVQIRFGDIGGNKSTKNLPDASLFCVRNRCCGFRIRARSWWALQIHTKGTPGIRLVLDDELSCARHRYSGQIF